jgi:hypothetical protein
MVTIKEAVQHTMNFAKDALGPDRIAGLQLEEVQSGVVEGKDVWLITLSMADPDSNLTFFGGAAARAYKIFAVVKASGDVVSMKIRDLAAK